MASPVFGSTVTNIDADRPSPGLKHPKADLLDAMEMAVIATDLDGAIVQWNRFAERLYGWSSDEVIGRNILDVTPSGESRERAVEIFRQLSKGEGWSGNFMVQHKDGRWFPVGVVDSPILDEEGKLVGIVGVSRALPAADALKPRKSPFLEHFISRAEHAIELVRARRHPLTHPLPSDAQGLAGALDRYRGLGYRFGLALLIFAVAVLARIALDQVVPERLPFITFFPAVLLVSLLCGPSPSVAVLLASAATGAFWGVPADADVVSFRIWSFSLFLVIGGLIAGLVLYLTDVLNQLRRRDEQLALINRELKHRLKNLFAITNSICVQTIKSNASPEDISKAIGGRIQAIASAQDLLSIEASEGSDLRTLVDSIVHLLAPAPSRLRIEGPAVTLPVEATTPFALILHELATNAVKHGAWAPQSGRVAIEWRVQPNGELDFKWREQDGPIIAPSKRVGLGSKLINRGLNGALVDHELKPTGLECRIRLPL